MVETSKFMGVLGLVVFNLISLSKRQLRKRTASYDSYYKIIVECQNNCGVSKKRILVRHSDIG